MAKRLKPFTSLLLFGLVVIFIVLLAKNFKTSSTITKSPETKNPPAIPEVSVESIFEKQNDLAQLDKEKLVTIIATGDVIPARGANWPAVQKNDFTYNWKHVADFLKKGDLTLINLEAPIMKGCPLISQGFTFCGDARHVKGLLFAGVDTASISNNHIGNFGNAGIKETEAILEDNKIGWSGFGHLDIQEVKGIKFGFLAFNGVGGRPLNREAMAAEIKEAREQVDVLVASIHWGEEYELLPIAAPGVAPDDPKEIGKIMVDAGVDLVVGNHPHWVQGIEFYRDKLITYAHGNFIFDQTWSRETQEGVVGEYTFYLSSEASAKEGEKQINLVNVKYYPILVDGSFQPKFLNAKDGARILKRMQESTKIIKESVKN